jgi:predicted RND superfamily exporter protein
MIAVRLASSIGANENVNIEVMKRLEKILKVSQENTGYRFYMAGTPAITASLVTVSQHDAMILMPLAVISVVSLLFILFRSVVGVLIPSVVIVFTLLITLSIQMILGYKLNNFTVNIPAFISAVSIAGSMHLFLAWAFYKLKYPDNKQSLAMALKSNLLPIGMTSLTTAIGFATLGLSKIEPISTLGIAITSGAFIAFLFTITLVPAIILLLKNNYQVKPISLLNLLSVKGYGDFIIKHDKKIVGIFFILFMILGWGSKNIKVDSNSIKYFKEDTVVRSGSDFIQKNLTGPMIYEVILDSKSKEGIKDPKFLEEIIKFEDKLKSKFHNVTFTTSLKDIVLRMHEKLNSTSEKAPELTKNLVAQYLLLYSMSLPQGMELNDKVDVNEQYLRVTLHSNIQNTSKDIELIDWIKNYWKTQTPYSADVQGQTAIFAYMQSSVTDTLVNSVSATLIIVSIAMLLIFKQLRLLLLFIFPNIAPVLLVAGVMGYLGIDIDIGIAISAAVILGIAVDDTIHFFSKYFDAIKTKPINETIDYILNQSGNAMIVTTFILSVTFAVFGVSSFIPNVNFAIVTIVALNLALVMDLVLLPAILSLLYRLNKA